MFDLEPPFAASEQWESLGPPGTAWQEVLDDRSGQLYYWNKTTGETSWECPWEEEPFIFFEPVEGSQSSQSTRSSHRSKGSSSFSTQIAPETENTKPGGREKVQASQSFDDNKSEKESPDAEELAKLQDPAVQCESSYEGPETPAPMTPPPEDAPSESPSPRSLRHEVESRASSRGSTHSKTEAAESVAQAPLPMALPSKFFRLQTPQNQSLTIGSTPTPPAPPPRPGPSIEAIGKLLDTPGGAKSSRSLHTLLALKQHAARMNRK